MRRAARLVAALGLAAVLLARPVLAAPNLPPAFTSSPPLTAVVGQYYLYDANASDPDNDPLTYYLTFSIDDMTVNPTTGVLTWTPTKSGPQPITVYVTDGVTAQVPQSFTVTVAPRANSAPAFTSQPIKTAYVGKPYTYDSDAIDPDGEQVYYSLDPQSPRSMTVEEATGVVSWTPGSEYLNKSVFVRIFATDINSLRGEQYYSIDVKAQPVDKNTPPSTNGTPVISVILGDTYQYQINATDADGDPLTYTKFMGPENMQVNSTTGLITWVPAADQLGTVPIQINISDGKDTIPLLFSISAKPRPEPRYFFTDPVRPQVFPEYMCFFLPAIVLMLQFALVLRGELRRQAMAARRPEQARARP
ncbi:MAG: hypothetical protein FJ149_00370 [Euryarchaeota archaeon]|nr:hypothetical protein [Euryarchaeota archaeon]